RVSAGGGEGRVRRGLGLGGAGRVAVVGVNLGRLGFLAEVDPPELGRALEAVGAGEYRIEERLALECTLHTDGEPTTVRAFNDVVVWRAPGLGQAALPVSLPAHLFPPYAPPR